MDALTQKATWMEHAEMITLRDYMDMRFRAMETALTVALNSLDARLASMNEFRSAMSDQAKLNVQRPEFERLVQDVQELREFRAQMAGVASEKQVLTATTLAVAGLILAGSGLLLNFLLRG